MKSLEKTLLEICGPSGLAALLRSLLPRPEMIRIANAHRVAVRGMRNRAVSIEHLADNLADRFVTDGPARRAVMKALQAGARPLLAAYRKLPAEEIRARLSDREGAAGDADGPKLLFLLIAEPREEVGIDELRGLLTDLGAPASLREPSQPAPPAEAEEVAALRREKADLSRRAADFVALVDRLRERDRRFREEIAQRKFDANNLKLQTQKARKERDLLEKEVQRLSTRLDQLGRKPAPGADLTEKVAQSFAETRRLASLVDKLVRAPSGPRDERPGGPVSASLARGLEELRKDSQVMRKELDERWKTLHKMAGDALSRLSEVAALLSEHARPAPEPPRRGSLDRVGVLVDVQNMFYAAKGYDARLDFDVLLQTITRGRRLIRAIAYVVEAKEIDQSGFIALLQQKRYEVKRKDLRVRSDGSFKGNWDMEIALDALELAPAIDVVVLVTGDGDFTGLVQRLKLMGPRVEVYSFPRNTSKDLREAADRFVAIDRKMLIRMPPPLLRTRGSSGSGGT